jgi:hypothetical protein
MKLIVPISLPLLAMAIGTANAALVLTNGNFQAQTVALNGSSTSITSWFESSTSNFADYLFNSTTQLGTGSTTSLLLEATTSYVYQSLGTTTGSEGSITVSGTAIDRYATSGGGRTFGAVTIQLFSGTPGSSGDGIALTGVTSLGTFTIGESAGAGIDLNLGFGDTKPETGTAAQSAFFTTTAFNLSALAPGTEVWLQISAPTSGTVAPNDRNPVLDDLSINVSAIPEPSTALLGGLGLLMLLRRRR